MQVTNIVSLEAFTKSQSDLIEHSSFKNLNK